MNDTTDLSLREINDQENAKSLAAFETAIKEADLFTSDKVKADHTFNRQHIRSAFYDLPSPPPFSVDVKTIMALWSRSFEIQTGKRPYGILKILANISKFIGNLFSIALSAEIPISSVAGAVGLPSEPALSYHSQQIRKWSIFALPFYSLTQPIMVLLFEFVIIIFAVQSLATMLQTFPPSAKPIAFIITLLNILILSLGLILIPTRLLAKLWTRNYQESICVQEIVYILFELKNDRSNSSIELRRNIQYRIHRLARHTLALAKRFSSLNANNQKWVDNHFAQMAAHVLELERRLLAPTPGSLEELRKDLHTLAEIYISGNYGSFQEEPTAQPKTESRWLRAFKAVGRLLIFLVPTGLMIWMLIDTTLLNWLHINASAITFLLIAWILLGIDSGLKLGVVSDLLTFAKGLRDLS